MHEEIVILENIISCDLIGDLPEQAAIRWDRRAALTFGEKVWSYQDFSTEVDLLSRCLQMAGVKPFNRVAVWLPNCPELEFLMFAVMRIGALVIPLNTRYKSLDLSYALKHSGSTFLIGCTHAGLSNLDSILLDALGPITTQGKGGLIYAGAPQLKQIVMIGESKVPGSKEWSAFRTTGLTARGIIQRPPIAPSDPAMIMYTSGTTGRPKGVLLNHAGLRLCRDRAQIMGMTADDVQLTYLPLFHIYAIGYSVIMSFMCGASQVLMEVFNAEKALRLIQKHRVSVIHGFEAHFSDLLSTQRAQKIEIPSLRTASFASGSETARAIALQVQEILCPTCSSYGLTEMWGGITISPPDSTLSQRCEGSGLAQPGVEIRIVDPETSGVLPLGEIGEIHVRSYTRLVGYYEDPAATAAAIDAEGWFRTGDAGILREDGHLRFLARYKDMLKVGGENVAPAEIEDLLCRIPGVEAAAVVGEKNHRLQEVPVAFLVTAKKGNPSAEEVISYFDGKVARFKIPSRVIFVDALPMTPTGKVQKELLRRMLQDQYKNGEQELSTAINYGYVK